MQNIYFVVIAKARSEAEAVAEAARLAAWHGVDLPVEVRECGTRRCIARVDKNGILFDASPEIEFKAEQPVPMPPTGEMPPGFGGGTPGIKRKSHLPPLADDGF